MYVCMYFLVVSLLFRVQHADVTSMCVCVSCAYSYVLRHMCVCASKIDQSVCVVRISMYSDTCLNTYVDVIMYKHEPAIQTLRAD